MVNDELKVVDNVEVNACERLFKHATVNKFLLRVLLDVDHHAYICYTFN